MEIDELEVTSESVIAYEERRGISPWLILGTLLFIFMFILGWRSAGGKKRPKPRDITLPPLDEGEPSV